MAQVLYVFVGGGLGSVARYLVSLGMSAVLGTSFPWATFTVNAVGSFLIGAVMQVAMSTTAISPDARLFLTTGVLGGFTTYSSFNYETLGRFEDGAWLLGSTSLVLTVIVCLVAGVLGLAAGRALSGT